MSSKYGTRNLIELTVGKKYSLRVQLHLPTSEVDWFNEDANENMSQLLSLVSKNVLPVDFAEDIDDPHGAKNQINVNAVAGKKKAPSKNSKSSKKSGTKRKADNNINSLGKKGSIFKQPKKSKDAPKEGIASTSVQLRGKKKEQAKKSYLSGMTTRFLFGETIQMTYRVKPIQNSHRATLTFANARDGETDSNATLSEFECLRPLPKMLIIYAYPFDQLNPNEPIMDTVDGGFPRPEFIPISSLFKEK